MGVFAPRLLIDAPTPTPRPFGLLAAAQVVTGEEGDRWENGVEWQGFPCGPASGLAIDCPPTNLKDAQFQDGDLTGGDPFVVYATDRCGPVGRTLAEAQGRASALLAGGEGYTLERAVWTGEHGNSPALAHADTVDTTPPGDTASLLGAIAILEGWLAGNVRGLGMIHAPVQAAVYLAEAGAIRQDGQRFVTTLGTPVAFGAGYEVNTGPDGVQAPAGEVWLYATGMTQVRRSEVILNPETDGESLAHRTNDRLVVAERVYVVTWPCGAAGVRASLSCCC